VNLVIEYEEVGSLIRQAKMSTLFRCRLSGNCQL